MYTSDGLSVGILSFRVLSPFARFELSASDGKYFPREIRQSFSLYVFLQIILRGNAFVK